MTRDPVCGMQIDEQHALTYIEHNSQKYYFCSIDCKQKFDHNPAQFISLQEENAMGKTIGKS